MAFNTTPKTPTVPTPKNINLGLSPIIWKVTTTGRMLVSMKEWPTGEDPIIYCHFLMTQDQVNCCFNKQNTSNVYSPNSISAFRPEQVLYIGERKTLNALKDGIRSYKWLPLYLDRHVFTYYTELEEIFKNKEEYENMDDDTAASVSPIGILAKDPERKTLEAFVYLMLLFRLRHHPKSLECNHGMQFVRHFMSDKTILKARNRIIASICTLIN